jgi:hypothetical protein
VDNQKYVVLVFGEGTEGLTEPLRADDAFVFPDMDLYRGWCQVSRRAGHSFQADRDVEGFRVNFHGILIHPDESGSGGGPRLTGESGLYSRVEMVGQVGKNLETGLLDDLCRGLFFLFEKNFSLGDAFSLVLAHRDVPHGAGGVIENM